MNHDYRSLISKQITVCILSVVSALMTMLILAAVVGIFIHNEYFGFRYAGVAVFFIHLLACFVGVVFALKSSAEVSFLQVLTIPLAYYMLLFCTSAAFLDVNLGSLLLGFAGCAFGTVCGILVGKQGKNKGKLSRVRRRK